MAENFELRHVHFYSTWFKFKVHSAYAYVVDRHNDQLCLSQFNLFAEKKTNNNIMQIETQSKGGHILQFSPQQQKLTL